MNEVAELVTSIIGSVIGFTLVIFIVFAFICMVIYESKCQQNQKQFIDLLSDEEKALILEYKENGKLPISVIFKKHNTDERSIH